MKGARPILAFAVSLYFLASPVRGQSEIAMLEPPTGYFLRSEGSWGQAGYDLWGLRHIGFDDGEDSAWRLVKRDAEPVTVAVIDSGIDWEHPNISWDNIWQNSQEITANGLDDDKNGYSDDVIGYDFMEDDNKPWDYFGHGTFVAGIIAADWNDAEGLPGINPFARIMVLKAINNFGNSRASYVAEAIAYAVDHGARVINLSVGSTHLTEVEATAIEYAYSKGAVLVIAAGNQGINVKDFGIASSEIALVVAATDKDDKRAGFSNWGHTISVAAPGEEILGLRAYGSDILLGFDPEYAAGSGFVGVEKDYYRSGGTSFSAPFVTGVASLMLSNDPSLTNVQVMNIIRSTSRDIDLPGVDQYSGYGLIDARAALSAPRDYLLLAGIDRLEVVAAEGSQAVRVYGIADADEFADAHLEIGAGEEPEEWTRIGPVSKTPGPSAALGDIPAQFFAGSPLWQVRVIVSHESGTEREARFRLALQ